MKWWGWAIGAAAAAGGYYFYQGYSANKDAPSYEGGQVIPGYHFGTMLDQNIQGSKDGYGTIPYNIDALVQGPGTSFIDGSFFGAGPLSLWTAGPMDYSDTFGDHRRGRRNGHAYGSVGDDFPAGAGGYGYHDWHGPGFPEAPPGGEGFDNAGQGVIGGFGGGPARTGGMPWPQQTTVGTQGQQYMTQKGDTLSGIAARFWGKGSDPNQLQQANSGVLSGRSSSGKLSAGLLLTIPGAPSGGPPAPGGPAGNGVGGGSIGVGGYNNGVGAAPPGYTSSGMSQVGAGSSSAGASGGGQPHQTSNSSRARGANVSASLASSGSQRNNNQKQGGKPPTKAKRR